ncbi:MAG TPA: GGDEF domain-containing protein [Candidatus Limnocylindria bacterium]
MSGTGGTVREETWYASLLSIVALGLVAWTTLTYRVNPEIAFDWPGLDASTALLAGLGYWLLFGLVGALRSRRLAAGSVLTFHMPFVVAGTILGGPVVGGWMGLLSQFERRELHDVPWYGLLGNHAAIAIAAVAAGAAGDAIGAAALALSAEEGVVRFCSATAVAIVFLSLNFVLVLPVLAIKRRVTVVQAARGHDSAFRATVLAEAILAWLMALVYVTVGWWAPIVCVVLVLVVWQAHDQAIDALHDSPTGLLNERGFMPYLLGAVEEARVGQHLHALLVIDMDGLGRTNNKYGTHAGDELIHGTAGRLRTAVRDTDRVARAHRRGDEFWVLLTDLPDPATALKLASRVHARISGPLQLRSRDATINTSGSVGMIVLDKAAPSAREAIAVADHRMQHAKRHRLGLLAEDPPEGPLGAPAPA